MVWVLTRRSPNLPDVIVGVFASVDAAKNAAPDDTVWVQDRKGVCGMHQYLLDPFTVEDPPDRV